MLARETWTKESRNETFLKEKEEWMMEWLKQVICAEEGGLGTQPDCKDSGLDYDNVDIHIHDIGMIEIELYRASYRAEPKNKVGR